MASIIPPVEKFPKRRAPRHLEKMLFINHKEDILLQAKLEHLNMCSKLSIMEIERERIKVRDELRQSRKKNLVVSPVMTQRFSTRSVKQEVPPVIVPRKPSIAPTLIERKHSVSDRRLSTSFQIPQPSSTSSSRKNSLTVASNQRRLSSMGQMKREVSIQEENEEGETLGELQKGGQFSRRDSKAGNLLAGDNQFENAPIDSVGTYVLGEFRRISQVVPSILMALARKQQQEKEKRHEIQVTVDPGEVADYEPDLHRVTKLVRSVKKLKHRMAISKKLEACRATKSMSQLIRENTENSGEYDEFTDGTCVLMKRKLEKKRRASAPLVPPSGSSFARRASTAVGIDSRRMSLSQQLPTMLVRSSTTLGFPSHGKRVRFGQESETQFLDEDEMFNRQRVARELERYDSIQEKVDQFLNTKKPQVSMPNVLASVTEEPSTVQFSDSVE